MDLDDYQESAASTDVRPDPADVAFPLLGLAGEVGELVAEYKKRLRAGESYQGFVEEVREELGDVLWYVAALARTLGISLNEVAEANLRKTKLAFGTDLPPASHYDADFPEEQQLPRRFTVRFVTADEEGFPHVRMYLGAEAVGDPLNDNAYDEDHYRFHDVLHLANAAVLGWSPLLRSLLRRKRKIRDDIDRVEDGARAIFIEEGLVAYLFGEAADVGFFADAQRVNWDLVKSLRRMTSHLEVSDQAPTAWQSMILQGFAAWRELRRHGGGVVEGDLDDRRITFVALPSESSSPS